MYILLLLPVVLVQLPFSSQCSGRPLEHGWLGVYLFVCHTQRCEYRTVLTYKLAFGLCSPVHRMLPSRILSLIDLRSFIPQSIICVLMPTLVFSYTQANACRHPRG